MKRVFTCPETEDLTGVCSLCGHGDRHSSDFECEQSYILELFDNVSGGDCADSAAELEEIMLELLAAAKKALENIGQIINSDPPYRTQWKGRHLELTNAIAKAEGRA